MFSPALQSFFTAWIETETDQSKIPFNVASPVGVDEDPKDAINIESTDDGDDEEESSATAAPTSTPAPTPVPTATPRPTPVP